MESIVAILTSPEFLTALVAVVSAIVPALGIPAWITRVIIAVAPVAVRAVEQKSNGATPEEKKNMAIDLIREMIPAIVRNLPGNADKIEIGLESAVHTMNVERSLAPETMPGM